MAGDIAEKSSCDYFGDGCGETQYEETFLHDVL